MTPSAPTPFPTQALTAWRRFAQAAVRTFHAYGTWLAGITWGRFLLLAIAFMIGVGVMSNLPPFSWRYTETVVIEPPAAPRVVIGGKKIALPHPPQPPATPTIRIEKGTGADGKSKGVDISIGEHGIHIRAADDKASATIGQPADAAAAASAAAEAAKAAASAASDAAAAANPEPGVHIGDQGVHIVLPPGTTTQDVKDAVEEARQAIADAMEEARHAQQVDIANDMGDNGDEGDPAHRTRITTRSVSYGDSLPEFAFLWILLSALLKATYKGRLQAEVKAAQATETAESESLKRQVVEARMAAMQAQVEPHFLFNTLASIDHLIETDPARASQMQKNLIALLRASMPTMRDTGDGAARDLGRELAVVRPYVEILKVRMEERLDAAIDVPDGLLSAEFPAMMIQTLVENAIRHGLEPKPEGGQLRVRAEIVHGKLAVTVADTGVGFGNAATAGTGVGLANIRERLQLLHGPQATLTVTANQPSGTVVTITVPYRTVASDRTTTPGASA